MSSVMEVKKFSFLLVLLIAFSATLSLADESEDANEATETVAEAEGMETDETETAEGSEKSSDEDSSAADEEVKEEDDVLVLTTKTFDSVVKDKDVMLVEFYAPWFVELLLFYCTMHSSFKLVRDFTNILRCINFIQQYIESISTVRD